MKITGITAVGALLLCSNLPSFAVEGLSIRANTTNIVLSWPSVQWATYIVQYRTTVDSSTTWETLTDCFRADSSGTTSFTNFGVIPPPSSSGGGIYTSPSPVVPFTVSQTSMASSAEDTTVVNFPPMPPVPWAFTPSTTSANLTQLTGVPTISANQETDEFTTGSEPTCGFYRVLQVPDFALDVTQYTYDGPTFLPVNFGDNLDAVQTVEVLFDGAPTTFSEFTSYDSNGQTYWGVGIYFDRISSGTHQIQLRSTIAANDSVDDNSATLVLVNNTQTITVDNTVSFPNWDDFITGASYTFRAKSKILDTDWYIDIYDYWGDFIIEGSGHTTDGNIAWTWDLRDWQGYLRNDLDYDPLLDSYITIMEPTQTASGTQRAAASKARTTPTPVPMVAFPKVGEWLFAYQDNFYLESGSSSDFHQEYVNSISQMRGAPSLWNYPNSAIPLAFGTNHTQAERDFSYHGTLMAQMYRPQTRNFFYSGHGNATSIGCDMHTYDSNGVANGGKLSGRNSKSYVTSQWVRDTITFNKYGGARPYRFVFLSGCNTANGDWPDAFGIGKEEHADASWYSSTNNVNHLRPSAFLGWTATVGGQGWGSAQAHWMFNKFLFANWAISANVHLNDAIDSAMTGASWPPNDKRQFLKKFGYTSMKFTELNTN